MVTDPRDFQESARLIGEDGYDLSIADITRQMKISRAHFERTIKEHIPNVWASRKAVDLLAAEYRIDIEPSLRFSRTDFINWFNKNSVMSRQTVEVNLFNYVSDQQGFKEEMEAFRELAHTSRKIEAEKRCIYEEYLNEKGLEVLDNQASYRFRGKVEPINLDLFIDPLSSDLIRPVELSKTPEIAYRQAFKHGLIKIEFGEKITYFINTQPKQEVFYGCPVPYSYYLERIKI